jgi:hypothetical protein
MKDPKLVTLFLVAEQAVWDLRNYLESKEEE